MYCQLSDCQVIFDIGLQCKMKINQLNYYTKKQICLFSNVKKVENLVKGVCCQTLT